MEKKKKTLSCWYFAVYAKTDDVVLYYAVVGQRKMLRWLAFLKGRYGYIPRYERVSYNHILVHNLSITDFVNTMW